MIRLSTFRIDNRSSNVNALVTSRVVRGVVGLGGTRLVTDERLEQFLTQCGVTWEVLDEREHIQLNNQWDEMFGTCFTRGVRYREGVKAQYEYSLERADRFLIVPFLGEFGGPHGIGKRGPRTAAYRCVGNGQLPDLSALAHIDMFVVPADWSWTMIHTHEDHTIGGPYLVRREWLDVPRRKPRK